MAKIQILFMEECKMVDGYTLLIMNGLATITRVPERHKKDVTYKLAVLGVDGFNNPISDEERQAIMDAHENAA
ncbi:hypothetical protein ACTHQ8_01995 [Lysinibacillus odysseyi]|nr:hypothetical protein [Lysinibacillus odysseyi]